MKPFQRLCASIFVTYPLDEVCAEPHMVLMLTKIFSLQIQARGRF